MRPDLRGVLPLPDVAILSRAPQAALRRPMARELGAGWGVLVPRPRVPQRAPLSAQGEKSLGEGRHGPARHSGEGPGGEGCGVGTGGAPGPLAFRRRARHRRVRPRAPL
jgi:hypothetical protein